jgi:CCR4-NOT transcription complex subunit 6
LLNEIESIGADLLCLQEVDFYETALERFLSNNGYVSVFRKRPGKKVDGCCIAVRGSRFELLSCVDWCYDSLADRFGGQSRIVRHNIGMAVGLRDTCSGVCFVLSTTHMLWDPLDADVKVLQAAEMVARTAEFAQCLGTPFMILAGDFNSTPESHAMKLLFDGAIRVPAMTECAAEATANTVTVSDSSKDRFPGNDMEREPPLARESLISEGSSLELPSNLSFCSAYAAANPEGLDIDWTNRRPHFTATIDYILFPSSTMEVRRVLWSPEGPLDEFYLPNADFPSDHIPTVAEMCFKRPE